MFQYLFEHNYFGMISITQSTLYIMRVRVVITVQVSVLYYAVPMTMNCVEWGVAIVMLICLLV